jgi:cell division septal protein FtsQ
MWLRRKVKNRRLKREHLLEVKVSSQQRRHTRWRMGMMCLSALGGILGLVAVFWMGGSWVVNRVLYENPAFAISRIEVQTDGVIPREQLHKWSGVKLRDNLLALDLASVQRNLQLVPLIREAAVEKVSPQTVIIRVTERVPVAQVHALEPRLDGTGHYNIVVYYLDDNGFVMARPEQWFPGAKAWRSVDTLPIVCGIDSSELHPGWTNQSARVQAALSLIAAFEDSPMFAVADLQRIDVQGVNAASPGIIQATTYQGSDITLLSVRLEKQLSRWRLIHDLALQKGKAIASLDLSVANNLPARWVEATSVPPVRPKPLKTIHTKKKNV